MAHPTLRVLAVAAALAGSLAPAAPRPAAAEPLPAPKEALRDYRGDGIIQIDLPPPGNAGAKQIGLGFSTWFRFRQAYVHPNRMLMMIQLGDSVQSMLVSGDSEWIYNPGVGYVIQRNYKNLDRAPENPMHAARLSMATYAGLLRDLTSGKRLPDEDLDAVKKARLARTEELKTLREKLADSKDPADVQKANELAAEHARTRDDLIQIDIRKANPCYVMEYPNKDLVQTLLTRGLVGDAHADLLEKGKTTVWVTKNEGLPIKIETTTNDGRVAISYSFTELKINAGIHPNEVTLGSPKGSLVLSATADLLDKKWEEKLNAELKRQAEAFDKLRKEQDAPPRVPRNTPKKGKR